VATDEVDLASGDYGQKHLAVVPFLLLVVAYLAFIQGLGILLAGRADLDDGRLDTTSQVAWAFLLPLGAALAFVYGTITALGWWRVVLHDPKPVQRWVWAVPATFVVAIVLGIDYGSLADHGIGFTLALLVAAMFVGFGEEGMFRAIGVNTLRRAGLTEAKVALWSSVIFGAVHLSNALSSGPKAIGQAVAVSFAGYFFYLIRRVSRSNILNSVLHGLFDFTILSGTAALARGDDAYPGTFLPILVYVVCGILLLVRRHHIEPAPAS
jgi:hypothetical protein